MDSYYAEQIAQVALGRDSKSKFVERALSAWQGNLEGSVKGLCYDCTKTRELREHSFA